MHNLALKYYNNNKGTNKKNQYDIGNHKITEVELYKMKGSVQYSFTN